MNMSHSVGSPLRRGERHYEELAALYEIAALNAANPDPAALVGDILRIVERVVGADRVLLFTCDERLGHIQLHDQDGPGGERFPCAPTGVIARVMNDRSGEVVNDLGDDDDDRELRRRTSARQIIAAPLLLRDSVLGVLAAVESRKGAFTNDDLRVLSLLGDRVAVTLENAKLLEALQRQVQELEGLQRLSRLLVSGDDLGSVIGESLRVVADLIRCEKIAILLYDADSDSLVAHPPAIGITPADLERLRIPLAEPSMTGTVFRTNTALSSNDAGNDAWVGRRFQELLGMETLLAVPLTTGPKPIGVLKVINATKGYFDERDMSYTTLLGRQVGAILESNLARARERRLVSGLKEADRTKSEFVSMLAHELNGPMTTVLGFSHTLREQWDRLDEGKRDHVLDIIHKEVGRLARLVHDLLDVSRMEAGTLRYELEPTALHEVVESILMVHTSLRSQHAVIENLPADLPKVLTDKDRIRQVIINLLTNATRYSPGETTVTLGADVTDEGAGKYVRLWVRDEGIGIPPKDVDQIFTKFSMLPKPGWTKKGTGLGLYITKGIVEGLGGRIWVESEVGRGSTFYVTLQIAGDEAGT